MLSPTGQLIVQIVANFVTPGLGNALHLDAGSLAHAGMQSALYGADFKDVLLAGLAQDLSDRAFYEVGSASMMASLGEGLPGFSDGGAFKVIFHAATGGLAAGSWAAASPPAPPRREPESSSRL